MFVLDLTFDDPRRLAARPAHRARLAELHTAGHLVMAGPWQDDSGALLVFSASRTEMDAILAADPYYSTPGVTVVALRRWSPILGPAPAGTVSRTAAPSGKPGA
ncbi:YciI family protein [Amycolatopsis azurea]|uniref:YciI family protein n=1 Tax=Amycolatopsis azurea TaxID=36819 RepID=UPI003830CA46